MRNPPQNAEIPFSIYYDPTDTGFSSNHCDNTTLFPERQGNSDCNKATVRFLEPYESAQTTEE